MEQNVNSRSFNYNALIIHAAIWQLLSIWTSFQTFSLGFCKTFNVGGQSFSFSSLHKLNKIV